ncbi:MAG TPA: glycosyltransferase family 87 protein [Allosphingosinicella sp.]|jgi:hypothetical protein
MERSKASEGVARADLQRLLFVATLGLAAAIVTWFIYLSVPVASWLGADFRVFWAASRLPGGMVYDQAALMAALVALGETGLRAFVSPPTLLLAMKPLAAMPMWAACAIWTALGLTLFISAVERSAGRPALLALPVAPAFHWAVIAGQVTLIVGGLIHWALVLLSRRPTAAGILFACAALLKPQAALLVPVALIASREWRALLSALAAGATVGIVSLLLQGPPLWFGWLEAVADFDALIRSNGFIANGITPAALSHSAGLGGSAALATAAGGALLGLACCWHVFRRSDDPALRGGAIVCGSLLCTPYALPYEAASLLPAAALLLTRPGVRRASLPAAALAICFPFSPTTPIIFAAGLLWAVWAKPSSSWPEPSSSEPLSSPVPSSPAGP